MFLISLRQSFIRRQYYTYKIEEKSVGSNQCLWDAYQVNETRINLINPMRNQHKYYPLSTRNIIKFFISFYFILFSFYEYQKKTNLFERYFFLNSPSIASSQHHYTLKNIFISSFLIALFTNSPCDALNFLFYFNFFHYFLSKLTLQLIIFWYIFSKFTIFHLFHFN